MATDGESEDPSLERRRSNESRNVSYTLLIAALKRSLLELLHSRRDARLRRERKTRYSALQTARGTVELVDGAIGLTQRIGRLL